MSEEMVTKSESYIRRVKDSTFWYEVRSDEIDFSDDVGGYLFFDIREVSTVLLNEYFGDLNEYNKGVVIFDLVFIFKSGKEVIKTIGILPEAYAGKNFEGKPLDKIVATRKHLQKILGSLR